MLLRASKDEERSSSIALAKSSKLLRKAETVRKNGVADDDEVGGEDSAITLNFIEIEPGGRGLTVPVTVRAPA